MEKNALKLFIYDVSQRSGSNIISDFSNGKNNNTISEWILMG